MPAQHVACWPGLRFATWSTDWSSGRTAWQRDRTPDLVDALCPIQFWNAKRLKWSIVTRAHAPRQVSAAGSELLETLVDRALAQLRAAVRPRPARPSAFRVSHSTSVLCGASVRVHMALHVPKRVGTLPAGCGVVGRGHVSLLTNSDTWHSKRVRDILVGYL
jgi:hypothetical protein